MAVHGGDIYTDGILKGISLIDFSSNINPLGVPTSFSDNIKEALSNLTRYPDIQYRSLRQYIIEYLDAEVEAENIVLGNGAAEIIDCVISKVKSLLLVVPSFGEYEEDAQRHGVNLTYSKLTEQMEYDYEDIRKKLEAVEALMLANPNNPNGCIINKDKFKEILDYCEKNNKLVIIDEAFVEFIGDDKASFMKEARNYSCLFIIRALTKFYALPGIRFGYGVSFNKELINSIEKVQNPWNINCFAEVAAKYVLKDKEYIEASQKWIREEREFMRTKLKGLEIFEKVYNTNSNYFLCKLKSLTDEELYRRLLEDKIVIRKCSNFRGLDHSFVRFAIKDRLLNERLIEALGKIVKERVVDL